MKLWWWVYNWSVLRKEPLFICFGSQTNIFTQYLNYNQFWFLPGFFLKMLRQQYLELDLLEQMQFICYFIQLCASLTLREILSNCSVYFKILSNFTDCQRNIVQMQHQIIHCQRKWNVAIFSCFSRISPPGDRNWKCIQKGAIKVLYFLQVRE